ncbi:MAG: hypothetical protein ABR507_03930 [Actinomycetota bacterium]|nr:hypothetical protein [Actinomycetota bacterium]
MIGERITLAMPSLLGAVVPLTIKGQAAFSEQFDGYFYLLLRRHDN